MPRAPFLTSNVVTSLEHLLNDMAPSTYLGTEKELGVKYLNDLVHHCRNPDIVAKRKKSVVRAQTHQKGESRK